MTDESVHLATVPELVQELQAGRAIVLVDDEDRENEGDLIVAAELITPDLINFMAHQACGLICLALTDERCAQLGLKLQEKAGKSALSTNFTVPVEAAQGVTTGISAADRAHTILTAVAKDACPDDLVQPGHIFPIKSESGGVLERAGHTEAGVDLCRLAGLEPAAVLVEIMNEDGTMSRRPQLEDFAAKHQLKMGSIADLIRHRSATERMVQCESTQNVDTLAGGCRLAVYSDCVSSSRHLAFVFGDWSADDGQEILVRVHQFEPLQDLAGMVRFQRRWSFADSLRYISEQGQGVLLLLAGQSGLTQLNPESIVAGTSETTTARDIPAMGGSASIAHRTVGIGSQILRDLGVRNLRILGSPGRYPSLSGFGLELTGFVTPDDVRHAP
ncbi:MAG: 3,4-dihydroxy-2-butanone-4-phosphate synthase [Gammaproteobacteria bacterium]